MVVHSAYCLINNSIPDTGGPFTVKFYDDNDNLIQTDANVPKYGDAHCTLLDGTIVGGLYFKGWNPSPFGVVRNLECHPVRGDYVINPIEIQDSWETICADGGAHYPLGAYKSLVVGITRGDYGAAYYNEDGMTAGGSSTGDRILINDHSFMYHDGEVSIPKYPLLNRAYYGTANDKIIEVSCDMVKVAEGEDGSTSTWISTGLCRIGMDGEWTDSLVIGRKDFSGNDSGSSESEILSMYPNMITDYAESTLNYMLETMLFRILPQPLKTNIKSVTKTYKGVADASVTSKIGLDKTIMCKVWALSRKELSSYETNKLSLDSTVHFDKEFTGVDYSSIWMPSWETLLSQNRMFFLRSMVGYEVSSNYRNKTANVMNTNGGSTHTLMNSYNLSVTDLYCMYAPFGFCL